MTQQTLYLGLGTGLDGFGNVIEQNGPGYARQPVSFSFDPVAKVGYIQNSASFGPSTGVGSWVYSNLVAVYDEPVGGNLLFRFKFDIGQISSSAFTVPALNIPLAPYVLDNANLPNSVIGTTNSTNPAFNLIQVKSGVVVGYNYATGLLYAASSTGGSALKYQQLTLGTVTQQLVPGNFYDVTLTGNTKFTLAPMIAGSEQVIKLVLRQSGNGGFAASLPPGINWYGGPVPTLNTTAGGIDAFKFTSADGAVTVFGEML